MSLSKPQAELLEYCKIPSEVQHYVALELGENGVPKQPIDPDFLNILCNLLQIYETRLENLRYKFGKTVNIDGKQPMIADPPPNIVLLEDEIKMAWSRASSLWKSADLIISNPEMFSVQLTRSHVLYAIEKRNLPIIELLRYAKPEFFTLPPISPSKKWFTGALGVLLGTFAGSVGGFMGGIGQAGSQSSLWRLIYSVLYAITGIFSGGAMGAMTGGSLGMQTGDLFAALRLAYEAARINPFHEPVGSKQQREVQLKREEILFALALDL